MILLLILALARLGPPAIYPRPDLGPGAVNRHIVQSNIGATICSKAWSTASIRPTAAAMLKLKLIQIRQYGFTDTDPAHYEEDHVIALEDGGHPTDPRNLYPEAYGTMVDGVRYGAYEKDLVEAFIHNSICLNVPNAKFNGASRKPKQALTLSRGRQILAQDWFACYLTMKRGEDCR